LGRNTLLEQLHQQWRQILCANGPTAHTNTYADPLHWEMYADTEAAARSSAKTLNA
jgi:hypothetical protein